MPISFWGLIFLGFLIIYPFFFVQGKSTGVIEEPLSFKKVDIAEVAADFPPWEIKADSAQIIKEKGTAVLWDVKGTFYKKNEPTFSLTSVSGILDLNRQSFTLNQVQINDVKGNVLTAKNLDFDEKEKTFFGRDNIELKGKFFRFQGETIIIDENFQRAKIKGKTRCLIEI